MKKIYKACPDCKGTGIILDTTHAYNETCPTCGGFGCSDEIIGFIEDEQVNVNATLTLDGKQVREKIKTK